MPKMGQYKETLFLSKCHEPIAISGFVAFCIKFNLPVLGRGLEVNVKWQGWANLRRRI